MKPALIVAQTMSLILMTLSLDNYFKLSNKANTILLGVAFVGYFISFGLLEYHQDKLNCELEEIKFRLKELESE